jgi:Site-specific recombinase XerD
MHAAERGEWVDPKHRTTTVSSWSELWLPSLSVKPKTEADYESILRVHVVPRWGPVRLTQLSRTEVGTWLQNLTKANGEPQSSATKRKVENVFSAMLTAAVNDGRLPRHPLHATHGARGQSLTETVHSAKQHRYLSHQQVRHLVASTDEHYRPLVQLLAYTGLRIGEALALRVRDYDALHGRLTVARTQTEVHGEVLYGPPKTHQVRHVVLPPHVRPIVAGLPADRGPSDHLFLTPDGEHVVYSRFARSVWVRAVKASGLAPLSLHDLRHTAASLAVSSGANVKAVQRMLGHVSASMTLDTYAGLFTEDLESVADRLSEGALAADQKSNLVPIRSF